MKLYNMSISIDIFLWTLGSFLIILMALIGFTVRFMIKFQKLVSDNLSQNMINISINSDKKIEEISERQDEASKEVKAIKENYISRFEKITRLINQTDKNLLKEISDIKVALVTIGNNTK